ncbi:MAG: hypothetical protein U0163_01540 [Gemmatimonadaceae bacterium]
MSRMYFLIMLLVAGLPIFFTTMVYGGVTASQIIEASPFRRRPPFSPARWPS